MPSTSISKTKHYMILIYSTGRIDGYKEAWILGDEFVKETTPHALMLNNDIQFFMKEHYNLKVYGSNRLEGGTSLSRMHNNLVKAIEENVRFPKLIIAVPDSDMIKDIKYNGKGISKIIGKTTDSLIEDCHKIIQDHKANLPQRAVRHKYPMIWMTPPGHLNFATMI